MVKELGKHPLTRFTLYDKAVYWTLPNDGASIRCKDCKESFNDFSKVILTQIPDGNRSVICLDCIDEYWLSIAVNLGQFKD